MAAAGSYDAISLVGGDPLPSFLQKKANLLDESFFFQNLIGSSSRSNQGNEFRPKTAVEVIYIA